MNTGIIIAIITIVIAAASGFLITRQKHVYRFNYAIQKTIDSIMKGRNCKVSVLEDFPEHERLFIELQPYLMFFGRRKAERAWDNYKDWYKEIDQAQKECVLNVSGADWQSETEISIQHLTKLLKKR